jgi:DNA-binding FadR family transcriptional regulator
MNNASALTSLIETPVSRRKLSDEVFDRLRRLIDSGQVKSGEQFPSERELTDALQVGRPVVREALQRLEQMGMLSISQGERARVSSLTPEALFEQIGGSVRHLLGTSPDTLQQLKHARLAFECAMVRMAVANASEHDLQKLREALDRMRGTPGSDPEFVSADLAFHETIASISGIPLYGAISRAMLVWLRSVSYEDVRLIGAEALSVSEHEEILKCIEARDEAGAVKAITDHLTRARKLSGPLDRRRK